MPGIRIIRKQPYLRNLTLAFTQPFSLLLSIAWIITCFPTSESLLRTVVNSIGSCVQSINYQRKILPKFRNPALKTLLNLSLKETLCRIQLQKTNDVYLISMLFFLFVNSACCQPYLYRLPVTNEISCRYRSFLNRYPLDKYLCETPVIFLWIPELSISSVLLSVPQQLNGVKSKGKFKNWPIQHFYGTRLLKYMIFVIKSYCFLLSCSFLAYFQYFQ